MKGLERYAKPVYGTAAIPSHNFSEQVWVRERDGVPRDPYQLLSPLFGERKLDDAMAGLEAAEGEVVANGAKAMVAYAKLQDPGLPEAERANLRKHIGPPALARSNCR